MPMTTRLRPALLHALSSCLFLVVSLAAAARASAQECPDKVPRATKERRALAKEWFGRGEAAQQGGDDLRAIKAYACSMKMVPHAFTAFNVAQSAENAGDLELSTSSYHEYLKMRPEAPDRAEVEQKIQYLEARIAEARDKERQTKTAATDAETGAGAAEQDAQTGGASDPGGEPTAQASDTKPAPILRSPAPQAQVAEEPEPRRKTSTTGLAWTIGGIGGAALASGIIFNLVARSKVNNCRKLAEDGSRLGEAQAACDSAKTLAYTSYVLLGAALAAAVADGFILYRARAATSSPSELASTGWGLEWLGLTPLPGGAAAAAGFRF